MDIFLCENFNYPMILSICLCRLRVTNSIDLNNFPNEEPCDNLGCELVDMSKNDYEGSLENIVENYFESFIGQCFLIKEEAYMF